MTAPEPTAESGFSIDERALWRREGWLRPLDMAFTDLLLKLEPMLPDTLLAAAALLSHLESRGHSNLPLTPTDPGTGHGAAAPSGEGAAVDPRALLLGWPSEGTAAASRVLTLNLSDPQTCLHDWMDRSSAVLEVDPDHEHGTTPLVLQGGRLYLRRYWRHEIRIAAAVQSRVCPGQGSEPEPTVTARPWVQTLFPVTAVAAGPLAGPSGDGVPSEPNWQAVACALALRARLTVITGGPGTGKTYTAARLLVLLNALHESERRPSDGSLPALSKPPLRFALAAPTGKAAARLKQSIDRALAELVSNLTPELRLALGVEALASGLPAAVTLHRLLGARPDTRRFARHAASPLEVDLLIVDEASMIHLEMMDALMSALPASARLVLLGDKDQLASVEAGAVMGDLCESGGTSSTPGAASTSAYDAQTVDWIHRLTGYRLQASAQPTSALARQTVMLRHSRRFSGPIGAVARAVNQGNGPEVRRLLLESAGGPITLETTPDARWVALRAVNGGEGRPGSYRDYFEHVSRGPDERSSEAFDDWVRSVLKAFDRMRVLCALRDGPWGAAGLNTAIEASLVESGQLSRHRDEWYVGRPVLVTRNDPSLGIFNGDIGIVLGTPSAKGAGRTGQSHRRAWFEDSNGLRSVSVHRLADVQTAFAMTVHKSQGSEFGHVVLALPDRDSPVLTRELLYTGITRAREACTVVSSDVAGIERALSRRTRRLSGLADRLRHPR